MTQQKQQPNYRIGAVSRLTGIPPDTLRVWERRYDLVKPSRSEGGGRLYSQEDVTRLSVIKRLVDSGHAIGSIAELSLEQLHQRLAETRLADQIVPSVGPVRVAIVGATLPQRLKADVEYQDGEGVEVIGSFQSREDLLGHEPAVQADVLVVELATLDSGTATSLLELNRHCGASRTFAVFGFGSSETIGQLERAGMTPLRFPVTWGEIRTLLGAGFPRPAAEESLATALDLVDEPPARLFTDDELVRAAATSNALRCECPRHLADMVSSLSYFETYSAWCESQNPEDAALHAYLHLTTAKARNLLEQALKKALEVASGDSGESSSASG